MNYARGRGVVSRFRSLRPALESAIALLVGLGAGAIIMVALGYDPIAAYAALFKYSFGSLYDLAGALAQSIPLALAAMTFAIGARASLFNIGAEGQLFMGALAAVAVSLLDLPPGLHHLVAFVAAAAAGMLWGLVPALLRAFRGVSEVISTIMFNWIGTYLAYYLVSNVLVDPRRAEKTISIAGTSRLPILMPGTDLSYGLCVAIALAVALYLILWHTVAGYEVRVVGANPHAARLGGVQEWKTVLLVFALGGIAAGLGGAAEVMGRPPTYALQTGMGNVAGFGFDGIGVAMIGRNHPFGIIFAAIFYGGLQVGARMMQMVAGVPFELVRTVEGIIVLALALPELLRAFHLLHLRAIRTSQKGAKSPAQGGMR